MITSYVKLVTRQGKLTSLRRAAHFRVGPFQRERAPSISNAAHFDRTLVSLVQRDRLRRVSKCSVLAACSCRCTHAPCPLSYERISVMYDLDFDLLGFQDKPVLSGHRVNPDVVRFGRPNAVALCPFWRSILGPQPVLRKLED